jgi:hypothetical protein
VDVTVYVWVV